MDKILKQKILIVEDDDQAVHKALKHLFESAGYSVELCRDAESALAAFRANTPAAIILNLRLPVLSGKDVCLQVKGQLSSVPIIILSASTDVVALAAFVLARMTEVRSDALQIGVPNERSAKEPVAA